MEDKRSRGNRYGEIDIGAIEADRGLALHFSKLNEKLASSPDRIPPGSLRERVAARTGFAILIDPHGKVASSSRAARASFSGAVPDAASIAERLHADDARRLRDAVTEHVIYKSEIAPRILRGADFHLIVRTLRCDVDCETFLHLETLAVEWSSGLEAILNASFGLTPAELRVVHRLVAGETVKTISVRFDRSEGTVRNQIKSILAKTGAGGIANLNRIVALIAENISGAPVVRSDLAGSILNLDILTLPDGRALEVRQQGSTTGQPILFIHGMLFGSDQPQSALDCLDRYGLRLIAPSRPNFGLSDPSPGAPENEPDRLVEDLVFVLDHHGLNKTVCLRTLPGRSMDMPWRHPYPSGSPDW